MLRYAQAAGLTPASRSRIGTGIGSEPGPGKFDGLID
jgi:hypothetical protein